MSDMKENYILSHGNSIRGFIQMSNGNGQENLTSILPKDMHLSDKTTDSRKYLCPFAEIVLKAV